MKEKLNNMFYGAAPIIHRQAKSLRRNETIAEKILWHHLSNRKIGVKFRRQHPVNQFIPDFYCHELKLIIEVDGEIHSVPENVEYDKARTNLFESYHLQVIRFSNREVLNNLDEVLNRIRAVVNQKKT